MELAALHKLLFEQLIYIKELKQGLNNPLYQRKFCEPGLKE